MTSETVKSHRLRINDRVTSIKTGYTYTLVGTTMEEVLKHSNKRNDSEESQYTFKKKYHFHLYGNDGVLLHKFSTFKEYLELNFTHAKRKRIKKAVSIY